MDTCSHSALELLPKEKDRLRCRHCHLTINVDELEDGYCPECFEISGKRRVEFEEIKAVESKGARYRCEECGVIIE